DPEVEEQTEAGTYTENTADHEQDNDPKVEDASSVEDKSEESSKESQDEESKDQATEDVQALENKVLELESELKDTNQRLLRVQADYDNFRRRTRIEKAELIDQAS